MFGRMILVTVAIAGASVVGGTLATNAFSATPAHHSSAAKAAVQSHGRAAAQAKTSNLSAGHWPRTLYRDVLRHVRRSVADVPFANFNCTFTPAVAPGGAVSMDNAIASAWALAQLSGSNPDVTVDAEYGTFTDNDRATMNASGQVVLSYVDTPVWVVTISGPGESYTQIVRQPSGEISRYPTRRQFFIVDATSGDTLLGWSN